MNEKEMRRMMHQGTENLIELGGFIQEEVENELSDLFSKKTAVAVEKYCGIGQGFWYVANETEKAFLNASKYDEGPSRERRTILNRDVKFDNWIVDHTARCATDIFKSEKKRAWNTWKIPRDIKRVLNELSPLEERILCLQYGLDGNKTHTIQQIANSKEFKCPSEYVLRIVNYIERELKTCASGIEKFVDACDRYHTSTLESK